MTIGDQVHLALNNLRGCVTDFKNFALQTKDKNAQKMYSDYAQQLDNIAQGFAGRVNHMENEEPQYKVYKDMQNKN